MTVNLSDGEIEAPKARTGKRGAAAALKAWAARANAGLQVHRRIRIEQVGDRAVRGQVLGRRIPRRIEQYTDVVNELPPFYFAPFSATPPTGDYFAFNSWPCQYWQRPSPSSPIVEPNAKYPGVPTLVLTGDLDNRVPHDEVVKVAALFPQSTLVSVE